MNHDKINALLATSHNLFFAENRGYALTSAEAAKLSRRDKIALAFVLREKGGSDLFTKGDADAVYVELLNQ